MKIKKILAFAVASALTMTCFAACGKEEKKANEIVIGGSGPLTGTAAQYGNAVKNAAELAVKEINENGGINGQTLKLVFEDDEADPGDKAVNAYNSLVDKDMQLFLGTVTSGSCLAVIEKSKSDTELRDKITESEIKVIEFKKAHNVLSESKISKESRLNKFDKAYDEATQMYRRFF